MTKKSKLKNVACSLRISIIKSDAECDKIILNGWFQTFLNQIRYYKLTIRYINIGESNGDG